jgi:hypothetical protein
LLGNDEVTSSIRMSVPDLGQMRSLTWVLKEVDPVDLHRQSGIHGHRTLCFTHISTIVNPALMTKDGIDN